MLENVTAVVMGRNYTSRLGMIRAAGEAGCRVAVVRTDVHDEKPDAKSRYVTSYDTVKESDGEGLVRLLIEKFGNCEGPVVLLPTDDFTASVTDRYQEKFPGSFLYPNIGKKAGEIVRCMDKALQKRIAAESGIGVAKSWVCRYENGAYEVPEEIEYPCFVKPETSYLGSKMIMRRCDSREELTAHLAKWVKNHAGDSRNTDVLAEEFISIEKEYALLGFCDGDRVLIPGIIEMLSDHRGVTASGIIRPLDPQSDLARKLSDMMSRYGFTGLFDVDMYESRGKLYFCELNLRMGASGYAVTRSGVNLPAVFIRTVLGEMEIPEADAVIPEEKTFASEKVCFQEFEFGETDWAGYRKMTEGADFCFLDQKSDPGPYKDYLDSIRLRRWKIMIKRLLKK